MTPTAFTSFLKGDFVSATSDEVRTVLATRWPATATCWSQATDELRDMSRVGRQILDLPISQALDFKALDTPADWNREAVDSILRYYDAMTAAQRHHYWDLIQVLMGLKADAEEDPCEALRPAFEKLARDPRLGFRRSTRSGVYINSSVARDWKWFCLGIRQSVKAPS